MLNKDMLQLKRIELEGYSPYVVVLLASGGGGRILIR